MDNAGYIALSRALALEHQLTVVAGNLANVTTTGFQAERLRFETVLVRAGEGERLAFVQDVGRVRDLRGGPLERTEAPLDLAIVGRGYFTVATPEGPAYTRAGHFQRDAEGRIVTAAGYPLLDENGIEIVLPEGAGTPVVSEDGVLSLPGAGPIARIRPVVFADEMNLQRVGDSLYRTDQAPEPSEDVRLVQGALERSNVEPVQELVRMIETVRAFEATLKLLETRHELERRAGERSLATQG